MRKENDLKQAHAKLDNLADQLDQLGRSHEMLRR